MSELKDQIVRLIEQDAVAKVAAMASSYPHARPEEREESLPDGRLPQACLPPAVAAVTRWRTIAPSS